MTEGREPSVIKVRVWDVPTRLIHWLLVVLIAFSWWSYKNYHMDWHRYSGYTLLGLVSFRIYWGFFGSSTARFRQFVRGPRSIFAFLRGNVPAPLGHNPLGAISVLALLALLVTQIVLGLFSVDTDGIESGPLSTYVSFETGRAFARWHGTIFNTLLIFIALHLLAVLFYVVGRKQNILKPMFTGSKVVAEQQSGLKPAGVVTLIVGIVLAAALAWAVSQAFQF
jgi:cytochrome b